MKRPRVKATVLLVGIPALAVLLLLILVLVAVLWRTPRELILLKNGRPMANLKAEIRSEGTIRTSTDADGRLDLSGVPWRAKAILITLKDGDSIAWEGLLTLPDHGSETIDFRGNTTITTTRTRVFGVFERTSRGVWTRSDGPDDAAKTKGGQADSKVEGQGKEP